MSFHWSKSHGGVTNFVICLLIVVAIFNDSFDSPSRGFLFIIVSLMSLLFSSTLTIQFFPLFFFSSLLKLFTCDSIFSFSLYLRALLTTTQKKVLLSLFFLLFLKGLLVSLHLSLEKKYNNEIQSENFNIKEQFSTTTWRIGKDLWWTNKKIALCTVHLKW